MPAGKTAPNHQFAGTPTFCSVAVDKGEQPGAYDDLEALVCLLLTSSIKWHNFYPASSCILSPFLGMGAGVSYQWWHTSLVRVQV